MATFLPPSKILSELTNLIDSAQEQVILIAPFLILHQTIQERIKDRSRTITFTIVLGKEDDIDEETRNFFRGLEHSKIFFRADLHTTCYLNEKKAILTSLNLIHDSSRDRYDMGVLIERDYDTELFRDLCREVERIIRRSIEIGLADSSHALTSPLKKGREGIQTPLSPVQGFCIRCGTTILYDPDKPFCYSCFIEWDSQGGNPYYKHQYCHQCRSNVTSSYEKPLCSQCSHKSSR